MFIEFKIQRLKIKEKNEYYFIEEKERRMKK